jgi:hypothetical protein
MECNTMSDVAIKYELPEAYARVLGVPTVTVTSCWFWPHITACASAEMLDKLWEAALAAGDDPLSDYIEWLSEAPHKTFDDWETDRMLRDE